MTQRVRNDPLYTNHLSEDCINYKSLNTSKVSDIYNLELRKFTYLSIAK